MTDKIFGFEFRFDHQPVVQDRAAGNVYVRMMSFAKRGDIMDGHAHTYDHITLLSRGRLGVQVEGVETEYEAPCMILIRKDLKHALVALEDNTVASCLHALHSQEMRNEVLSPDFDALDPLAKAAPLTK